MKPELGLIYRELSAGRLSEQEALQQIQALQTSADPQARIGSLLATPEWEDKPVPVSRQESINAGGTQHILLHGLSHSDPKTLEPLLPDSRCSAVHADASDDVSQAYTRLAVSCFETIQAILKSKPQGRVRFTVVAGSDETSELFIGLSGMFETAALENPRFSGQIVLVPSDLATDALAKLLSVEQGITGDRVVRYTGDVRQVRRWQVCDVLEPDTAQPPAVFKTGGVYLITGGLGGLGVLFARDILKTTTDATVVLSGRTALDDAKTAALQALRDLGGQVEYVPADIADRGQAERLVSDLLKAHGQLNGIIHSAGVVRDDFILKKTSDAFRDVLLPKVTGAHTLDLASRTVGLDFFLLFSSIAAWCGNLGQADYAAANGFLDRFATYRDGLVASGERTGRTISIAWPHWRDGGMTIDAASMAALQQRTGLRSLDTETGMRATRRCLMLPHHHLMAMQGDVIGMHHALLGKQTTAAEPARALAVEPTSSPSERPPERRSGAVSPTVTVLPAGDLLSRTRDFLRTELAAVLKLPADRIDTRAPMERYGIDSILAMSLTSQLEATFGTLAKTLFFEYLTLDELAGYFVQSHSDALTALFAPPSQTLAAAAPSSTPASANVALPVLGGRRRRQRFLPTANHVTSPSPRTEPIAIVGLSGRYPEARDLGAFWRNLRDGRDCIVEIPAERWDWRSHYSEDRTKEGAHYSKWGGFIEGVDEFDPRFFGISPREAHTIDPQERLFLQHAWMAVEDAGYTRASLQTAQDGRLPGQVGVYAGVMYGEYNLSGSLASIANRVSYVLNLHGPSLTLDTMCSSSLTAIHLACQDLRLGRTNLALAGGVNVSIHPNKYRMLSGGQFISSDGHCQSFGEGGDGYIPGEGVGVAVLKRLSDAERDGNPIYGVIRGSALNHGGKTNGYTVPNPQAQADVIRQALAEAGIDPRHVSYIEAHGTGTKLGDPIEIAALTKAFRESASPSAKDTAYCRIGSAKSNIGHCESAAGIAGVTKVLLQMKHGAIVPSLHSRRLNPHIDFKTTPFVVNQTLTSWEAPQVDGRRLPRIAGISSFGAGGSNAHVIIEEYPARTARVAAVPAQALVTLSARTVEQLRQRASDLRSFLHDHPDVDLRDVAYTLQIGREAMEARAALLAESLEALARMLDAFVNGNEAVGIYRGQVKAYREALAAGEGTWRQDDLDRWTREAALAELAQAWVKGAEVDWRGLNRAGEQPRLISLPTYPFAQERYWIDPQVVLPATASLTNRLHPLVHANTSDLTQQRYSSNFTGTEPYLHERDAENKALPPLLMLEMVRAVVELASPKRPEAGYWEIQQAAWDEPLLVQRDRTVQTAVFARDDDRIDVEIYSDRSTDDGSDGDTDDRVHCQSHVVFSRQPAPNRVDIGRIREALRAQPEPLPVHVHSLRRGEGQLLAELAMPTRSDQDKGHCALSPELLGSLGGLLNLLVGHPVSLSTLACLRVVFACPDDATVWLRLSSPATVDIDVFDKQGHVCLQFSGLQHQSEEIRAAVAVHAPTAAAVSTPPVVKPATVELPVSGSIEPVQAIAAEPREVPLVPQATALTLPPPRAKPTGISLVDSSDVPSPPTLVRAKVVLSDSLAAHSLGVAQANARLFDLGNGVFSVDMTAEAFAAGIDSLLLALERARQEPTLKALLLTSNNDRSWQGDRAACNAAAERRLFATVAAFPCPVIAAVPNDASGAGWLLAAVCDFLVCSEQARYCYTQAAGGLFPSEAEAQFFRERLGDALADDFLYRSTRLNGEELRQRGLSGRIVPSAQVAAEALQLATDLAQKSPLALRLLKTHLNRRLLPLAEALVPVDGTASETHAVPESDGVLCVRFGAGCDTYGIDELIAELTNAIGQVAASDTYRCVVLSSALPGFLPAAEADALQALRRLVQACPVPVVAAFESDADGAAWWFGLWCDACVYQAQGRYALSGLAPELEQDVVALSALRLGPALGREACVTAQPYSGAEMKARAGSLAVAEPGEVLAHARQLAGFWCQWRRSVATAWKQAGTVRLRTTSEADTAAVQNEHDSVSASTTADTMPPSLALRSSVVTATVHPEGVVVVAMHDRQAKNMFSTELVDGLKEAFDRIEALPGCKAVVLTGYDSYFATGGTRETLLAIQEGQAQFTDETVFQRPLDFPLPVIAAIQGHGIGGGWSFGMFADVVLLSEESRYLSPYMGYGFTPGAGSTLVFPEKIGYDLARETLLTAKELSGRELQARGATLQVLPRKDVVNAATDLALRIARQPRARLQALKRRWTRTLRREREDTYRRELEMHERTFVRNADTLAKIQSQFADAPQSPVVATPVVRQGATSPASIIARIRQMLAQELFLKPEEIDDDAPFIDLGLDSITGVTWIRKINAHYGTDIEATKVYTHSTLAALSRHISEVAGAADSVAETTADVLPVPQAPAEVSSATIAVPSQAQNSDTQASVIRKLKGLLAKELHLQPDEIDDDAPFIDLGLDSITGVTWVRKINEHYGTDIEATKVYSHPTLNQIGRHVREEAERTGTLVATATPVQSIGRHVAALPVAETAVVAIPSRRRLTSWRPASATALRVAAAPRSIADAALQPIAVIGMAGQFPKARNVDEFWSNLAAGRDCISEISADRWSLETYYREGAPTAGRTNSKWLGALDDYDQFDPLFFNISPTEAECMDPQQRLFLQACWHSIENAGYNPQSLSGSQCGVFVGCGPNDYHQQSRDQQLSAQGFTGAATSILAARISYFLNLRGPCLSIDTACSSSLVAIANACESLNAGNSDLALAGGVYVMGGPAMHIMTAQAGMLSTDGRCFTFDQRANGFVAGEAVGVVMLKRLADAERDGDHIQAIVQGWGVNQDGKTNGITAPNEDAQARLLQSVYRKFKIDPDGIQLIEAHGTGTKLGDPIEIAGLKAAFEPFTDRSGYCALGSVKSNIGHCLTAAGAAGIIKLVLSLKHKQLPPTLHYRQRNEHIQLDGSPFYVNDRLRAWEVTANQPRRAAVSSFGFSGTNAHIVLAEYDAPAQVRPSVSVIMQNARQIVPLSARTEEQLRQQARNLLTHLREQPEPVDLTALAYTLQTGRDAMGERLAIMAADADELVMALDGFLAGRDDVDNLYQGQVKRHKEGMKLISQDDEMKATIVEKWLGQRKLSKLVDLWVKGLDLDWNLLYGDTRPQRVALPVYPFARQRYWLSAADAPSEPAESVRLESRQIALKPDAQRNEASIRLGAVNSLPHDGVSYVHRWVPQTETAPPQAATHRSVLVVCTDRCFQLEDAIREAHAGGTVRLIRIGTDTSRLSDHEWSCGIDDPEGFSACLKDIAKLDALYFLAGSDRPAEPGSIEGLRACQDSNEIQLLRLVKLLKQQGKIDDRIDTYVLTVDGHPIGAKTNRYWGAGASGLAYSLAQGNHQFRVRNLDLSSEDLENPQARSRVVSAILREPASDRGELFKLHAGQRYRQTFFRLNWGAERPTAIKQQGVYLIVGGSGIVGRIITRHLIEQYQANVIWLGRSPEASEKTQDALREFAAAGDKLRYVQADALDEASLRQAVARVKQTHARIDGAVFSGMVFGTENSIDQTTEAAFRSILEVKTLGSQAFYNALRDEPLDFMCFFSSGQAYAFSGASKLSAYSTGIAFGDRFVQSIQGAAAFPVGTINWGFWRAAVRERIEKLEGVSTRSLDALEDAEGFACFERFIGALQQGDVRQVLCMRASREVEALMNCSQDEFVTLAARGNATPLAFSEDAIEVSHERIAQLVDAQARSGLNEWFAKLLFCQIDRLVAASGGEPPRSVAELRRRCGILDKYALWLDESINLLAERGVIQASGGLIQAWGRLNSDEVWTGWRSSKPDYIRDPEHRALVVLIDECLEKLPEILQGRIASTDVIFPNSSMEKVAGLYRNNAVADTFNETVANTVLSYLRRRLQADPQFRLRILEVGAGTGGTSAIVFSKLAAHKASVERYCYTDLSKAFFFHAEKNYLPDNPYIVCQRLDIEQPVAEQGIEVGSYDLVIATNALHATKDIRRTLRHAKSALRKDGMIVLSEMSDRSLSTHLTFGLLDGWWLFQDPELRIPGCPGLYPATWQQVMEEEGFSSVLLPGREARALGNQVIVAKSDGAIRLSRVPVAETRPETPRPQKRIVRQVPQDTGVYIRNTIVSCLSATLKIPADNVETDIAFSDYGIDSILGVNFIEQLNERFSIALNTAIIFEYSSIDRLSKHIGDAYGRQIEARLASTVEERVEDAAFEPASEPVSAREFIPVTAHRTSEGTASAETRSSKTAEIAIIGMSGKFPKAGSVQQFWDNLIAGVDGVEELPPHYLDQSHYFSTSKQKGKTRCKWGGILADRDCFDPLFFNISPKEAESMNPHQRLVMQESWNALEDAGYNPKSLSGTQTGIFIGAEPSGYIGDTFTGLSDAIIASRLSYALNFNGPAFVVNTGCSSSAVAIHLACESLRNGESGLVVAGGVNACMHKNILVRLDEIEMLSPSGRCYTFDKAGDGTIISEGVGMIVLKRLDDAVAAGDHIYATICGSGMNQDGASNGITAPNGAAQEQLILSVYDRFGIDPEQISYVEAHGTGTRLGDPVETNALVRAFGKRSARTGWCAVGSAKSHIGHAAAAAGVIGIIKVLLSMKHRQLPKLLNFNTLNPLIEFAGSPFYITAEITPWTSPIGVPRMAAINSFGHSGTNVHLVLKEFRGAPVEGFASGQPAGSVVVPLSAKTEEQLLEKCRALSDFLANTTDAIDLRSLAYTLQTGREAMDERVGFVVNSPQELADTLRAYVNGQPVEGIYRGQAKRNPESVPLTGDESPEALLALWVKGRAIDWARQWPTQPARMSLPGYPFAKERYWMVSALEGNVGRQPAAVAVTTSGNDDPLEDIINRIDDDSMDTHEGLRQLRMIV